MSSLHAKLFQVMIEVGSRWRALHRPLAESVPQRTRQVRQQLRCVHLSPTAMVLRGQPGEAVEYELPAGWVAQ